MSEKNKQILRVYQKKKNIMELIKAESLNLIKNV